MKNMVVLMLLKIFKPLFLLLEKTIVWINDWNYIPESSEKIFYIVPHKYKGDELNLSDGTIIRKNDIVAEVHIDNLKTKYIDNKYKKIFRLFDKELKSLTYAIIKYKEFTKIKAYHGTTILHPIAKRKGFTIITVERSIKKYLLNLWDNILKIIFSKKNNSNSFLKSEPKECWISKETLLKRYSLNEGK